MTTRESARHLVVGNSKMHGHHATNEALLEALRTAGPLPCDVAVCPRCPTWRRPPSGWPSPWNPPPGSR